MRVAWPAVESLDALARLHGTDKASGRHGFAEIYEPFLAPRRAEPVTVLELGVKAGASLRMWRDYFTSGEVFGVDINATALAHAGERVRVFVGSQSDTRLLDEVVEASGPLDLIVDDGSHRYADQRASLLHLWPHLRRRGLYVVEDTHTSYLERYGMGYRQRESTIELLKEVVDDIHAKRHGHAPVLGGVASVQFFRQTCVVQKR